MRLFVAVELDEATRANASRAATRLAEALGPEARRAVTWVAASNLHVTLRFLGEVEEGVASELKTRLQRPFDTPAFELRVAGLGAFPPAGPPRVFWLGLTSGAERLAELHDEIEARLDGLGFEREDRPFRAHLTLARVKGRLHQDARRLLASTPADAIGGGTVSRVTLFESRLSPRGAIHTALAHGPLAQASPSTRLR